jgi:TonB family protein
MDHGSAGYFEERSRNERRLAALSVIVGLAMLAPLVVLRTTSLGPRVREAPFMRFGFAGPPRYVELMQIDAQPTDLDRPHDVGRVVTGRGGHGGTAQPRKPVRQGAGPSALRPPGPQGESGNDLVARALASRGRVPVMMSNDLVIETLVRPEYPEEAQRREIEGHVAVLARVDTLGRVAEAEVMTPSGEPLLDRASLSAVLRCRFRPYRLNGNVTEVYAVFRFAFRIY